MYEWRRIASRLKTLLTWTWKLGPSKLAKASIKPVEEAAAIDDQAVSFASRVVDPVDKGALAARLAKPHGSAALSRPVAA